MPNKVLSPGVPDLIVDDAVAVGVDNAIIFSIPGGPNNKLKLKLVAIVTGAGACSGKLLYRNTDDTVLVEDGPDDNLDFVAFAAQVVEVSPGQYQLQLDTMAADEVDIYAILG